MSKVTILNAQGNPLEVTLEANLYREAHENELSVAQLLERKFGAETNAAKFGTVLEQMAAASGLIRHADPVRGFRSPTLADVFNGTGKAEMQAGIITRDGQPASRILFPAVFLQWIENALVKDFETQPQIFESMIAISDSIAGPRFEQPVVDFTKPQGARSQGIAQGAMPANMMTITASDVARKIPTFSLGVEISDEALKATSLDFLALSLQRQVAAERDARVEGYISAMVSGDTDLGMAALAAETTTSFDSTATGGIVTQKSWVKWLFNNFRFRHISHVICDVDTALKIESRTSKPVVTTDDPNSPRIDATFQLLNYKLSQVKMFIVSAGVVPASTVVGLDSRYAIRRVRNSEAEYQAAEQFVMKKTQQLRFDFGEIVYRLFDQSWDQLTIA